MDRRMFLGTLAGGLLTAPLPARAQSGGKTWRVGFLSGGGQPPDGAPPLPLRQALQELGYVEQRNVIYVSRWANAKQDRLPGLAAELVGLKVDVIVTVGGPSSAAAKQVSPSTPVVMALVGDADGSRLVLCGPVLRRRRVRRQVVACGFLSRHRSARGRLMP